VDAAIVDPSTTMAQIVLYAELPRASLYRHAKHLEERGVGDDAVQLLAQAQGLRRKYQEFSVIEILRHVSVCMKGERGETHGEAEKPARKRARKAGARR
jgi:hypothetical protein